MLTISPVDNIAKGKPKIFPKSRAKKLLSISPIRITTKDACYYMSMGETKFKEESAKQGLTVSVIGSQNYYKISELDQWFVDKEVNKKV